MKILTKIDKFYIALIVSFLAMAFASIAVIRGIFSALEVSSQVDETLLSATTPRLEKDKLENVVELIRNPEFIPLDL